MTLSLQFFSHVVKRSISVLCAEIYSREDHLIFGLKDYNERNDFQASQPYDMRKINDNDEFISDWYKQLAAVFLSRGDFGIGCFFEGKVVGFLWVRKGECAELVGREMVLIPSGYYVIHHLMVDDSFRGKGIAKILLSVIVNYYGEHCNELIAFVKKKNLPSIRVFNTEFQQIGYISSCRIIGIRLCRLLSPKIPLSWGSRVEYRSVLERIIDTPIHILRKPQFEAAKKPLIKGVIGGLEWQSILTGTVIKKNLPAILHASTRSNIPVLLPISVSPGSRFWRFRAKVEPTYYQVWPSSNENRSMEIVSAVLKLAQSPWIETLDWTIPYWLSNEITEINYPQSGKLSSLSTWVLELDCPYDEIKRKKFSKTTRQQILMAKKRGCKVIEQPTREQIKNFSDLWALSYKTRQWRGLFLPEDFFLAINSIFKNKAKISLVEFGNQIVAGGIFLEDPVGIIYYLSAMNRDFKDYYPMDMLFDHVIREFCENGKQFLNMGGIGINNNLSIFKERWGAKPIPVYKFHFQRNSPKLNGIPRIINSLFLRIIQLTFFITQKKYSKKLLKIIEAQI